MDTPSDDTITGANSKIVLITISAVALLAVGWFLTKNKHDESSPTESVSLNLSNARNENGLFYAPNETEPFTGVVVEHYEEGSLKSKTEVEKGKLNGLSEGWHENGQLQIKEHYLNGVSHGLREKWRQDGSKESVGEIKNGKFEGTFRKWHPNGQLAEEIQMLNGVAHGESKSWHENGDLKAKVTLDNGEVIEQEFYDKKTTQ